MTRTVTARIRGTSPMFLPDLLPATTVEGVAAYANEPALEEADDRGVLSGTRTERVTLVAEGGGSGEAPPVSLEWYNLETDEVETATLEGFAIALIALAGALALALALWLLRRFLPPLGRWLQARHADWLASEAHAYADLRRVAGRRDYAALHPALDTWAAKVPGPDPRRHPGLQDALTQIVAARYGRTAPGDTAAAWRVCSQPCRKRGVRPVPRTPAPPPSRP